MNFIFSKKWALIVLIISIFFLVFSIKIDVSSFLANHIEKEIKNISGLDVSISKIYLKILPFSLEIKDLAFQDNENYIYLKNAKIYFTFQEILNKQIEIKRVLISNFNFSLDEEFLNNCIENIKNSLKNPYPLPFKIKVSLIEVEGLNGLIYKGKHFLKLSDFYGRGRLNGLKSFNFFSSLKLSIPEYPNINSGIKISFNLKDDQIILEDLKIFDPNSLLSLNGNLNYPKFLGEFFVSGKIFLNSLMNFLGIKNRSNGQLSFEGKIFFREGKKLLDKIFLDINFNGFFFIEDLMKFLKVYEKIEGYTEVIEGKIQGSLSNLEGSAQVKQKEGNILGIKIEKLTTEVLYRDKNLEFKSNDIYLYGGKAKAYVKIPIPTVWKHYVSIEVKGISSSGVFDLINWNPQIAKGSVDGWLFSEGKIFSPKGIFIYRRNSNIPNDVRGKVNSIKGEFQSDGKVYNFKYLEFILDETKVLANGNIDVEKEYLDFYFTGNSNNISELIYPYQKAIYGDLYFRGKVIGQINDPQINLEFSSKEIKVFFNELVSNFGKSPTIIRDIEGDIRYSKNLLVINNISSTEKLYIKGKINFFQAKNLFDLNNPLYDIDFTLKNLIIDNLYFEPLKKYINTKLDIKGSVKGKGEISGNIITSNILLGKDKVFDKSLLSIKYDFNSINITSSSFYSGNNQLLLHGNINFDGKVDISIYSDKFEIISFIRDIAEKIGVKNIQSVFLQNLRLYIKNTYKDPDINGYSEFLIVTKLGKTIDGAIKSNYSSDILQINLSCLRSGNFDIRGFLDKGEWRFNGNLYSTRIDSLLSLFLNNLPEDLVSLVDGTINGTFKEKINAQITLNRLFTRIYGVGISNKSTVKINIKNNNVYFEPLTLIGQSTELTIKGKIVDYFDILIEGSTDLKPLKPLLKVDDIRGRASVMVYIYEQVKNPEIVGEVNVIDSSITLKKDIPTLNNINGLVTFNEDRILIEKARGRIAEGNIEIGGGFYLKNFSIQRYALTGTLHNIRWIFSPRSWAFLNGELHLTGSAVNPQLIGNISINKGVYREDIDFVKLALKSNGIKSSFEKDSWLNNLALNLKLQSDSFSINNNLADMFLKADLLLKGTFSNPSLLGWIMSKEGWIYFRGNKFEIQRLLIQFNDPKSIRPYLNISAKSYVSQYNVNLNINGYIDQFNLILNSNPPLAENELLNLLLIGQNGTSKRGLPGVSEATSIITGQIQGLIEERVRTITGFDTLSVEPTISKTSGTVTPRVTIGKKLLNGKLNVTYSTGAGTTTEQIIKIEYIIKKGVSLLGLRDEIGGLSGAIKFRLEFH